MATASARDMYRVLRRMDRIGTRLDSPRVRGVGMNLCWLDWMGRFSDAMDLLPKPAFDYLANDTSEHTTYVEMLPAMLAVTRAEVPNV